MQDSPDVHVSPFESIRQVGDADEEYWSARDLAKVLGYTNWRNFVKVIEKATEACENSGHLASEHIVETDTMIPLGKGAQRRIDDWLLSRYACYLVVQNADPAKEIVALGQTYFAVQTRRAEVADELASLTEDQRRLYIRAQLTSHNRELAAAASDAGVVTPRDFAIFQDHGYKGLYNGETARDIAARKGLRPGQPILDHMGSTELAANLFRATQAEDKLRREGIQGKSAANRTHFEVGKKVRQTIAELGGTMPEDLPAPAESIAQVQKRQRDEERRRIAGERQPNLYAGDPDRG
jgi:DNA-damage-inducible protein D